MRTLSLEGDWIGGFETDQKWVFITACFQNAGEGFTAIIDIPLQFATGLLPQGIALNASHIHFELSQGRDTMLFDGQVKSGMITGDVRQAGREGHFGLVRIARLDPGVYEAYSGEYQLAPDRFITVARFNEMRDSLFYLESRSGRFGLLHPLSETTFFAGPSHLVPFPIDMKITFVKNRDDEVTSLIWHQKGFYSSSATKIRGGSRPQRMASLQ